MKYIENYTTIFITIIAIICLSACGSNSKEKVAPATKEIEVHLIKPSEISTYVEDFKQNQALLELQFEGQQYQISLIDISMDENFIIASYELGYLIIGFEFSKEQPIASLVLVEGDIENEAESDRVLNGTNIEITEQDGNHIYTGSVVDKETQGLFSVHLVINKSLLEGGSSTIKVVEDKAFINGDLGTNTYIQMNALIQNHPEVKILVLQEISGSINDAINMHTGRLVRNAQLTTMVPANGDVNSGGVDLFAAGVERKHEQGGKLGVHSWCCVDGKAADQLSKEHSAHDAQLTYFREMLGNELGPDFYFFTLESSPFEEVHVMTNIELEKYLITE